MTNPRNYFPQLVFVFNLLKCYSLEVLVWREWSYFVGNICWCILITIKSFYSESTYCFMVNKYLFEMTSNNWINSVFTWSCSAHRLVSSRIFPLANLPLNIANFLLVLLGSRIQLKDDITPKAFESKFDELEKLHLGWVMMLTDCELRLVFQVSTKLQSVFHWRWDFVELINFSNYWNDWLGLQRTNINLRHL